MPSFAIKFLLDYVKSDNLFGMPNFTGKYADDEGNESASWDFFRGTFKNRVERFSDDCNRDAMEAKMIEGNNKPYATGVALPAFWTTGPGVAPDGTANESMHTYPATTKEMRNRKKYQYPFQLEYEGVHNFPNDRDEEWYDRLKDHFNKQCVDKNGDGHCESGVKILDVYAWTAPEGTTDLNGDPRERVKIAEIELKTKLYTSEAGDERLYFQHNRVVKDQRSWPKTWKNIHTDFTKIRVKPVFPGIDGLNQKDADWPWPSKDSEAEAEYLRLLDTPSGCPFSWLF